VYTKKIILLKWQYSFDNAVPFQLIVKKVSTAAVTASLLFHQVAQLSAQVSDEKC
jgi:hypothetical protein